MYKVCSKDETHPNRYSCCSMIEGGHVLVCVCAYVCVTSKELDLHIVLYITHVHKVDFEYTYTPE